MPTTDYGIDEAEKALIDRFHPCLKLESNSSPMPLPDGYEDPNPYRAEIQRSSTCKAPGCGREIVQIGRGHRQREYCDDTCKQRAFQARREQEHRDEVNRRWQAFTPETRSFLDWIRSHYGEDLATAIEAAINRELDQQKPRGSDPGPSKRERLQLELLALGELLDWRRLINGQTMIMQGEDAWNRYGAQEESTLLESAIRAARFFYDNLKELGMLS